MGDISTADGSGLTSQNKKRILLNAFDMSTVGHLSPGQWKVCFDLGKLTLFLQLTIYRTRKTNQPPNANSTTGLIWQSY